MVDGAGIDGGDGPGYGALADTFGEHFAAIGVEQFAIVQAAHGTILGENDSAGEHGPKERAAADLVHSCDGVKPARAQLSFQGGFTAEFAIRRAGLHGGAKLSALAQAGSFALEIAQV